MKIRKGWIGFEIWLGESQDPHWVRNLLLCNQGLPGGLVVKNPPAMKETRAWSLGWGITWRRKWKPTAVFLPGRSHGWRSLVGYSPRGCKRVGHNLVTKQQHYGTNSHTFRGSRQHPLVISHLPCVRSLIWLWLVPLLRVSQGNSQGIDWGLDSYLRLPVSPQLMWSLGDLNSLQL